MKKWDKIIIALLAVISFLPYLLFKVFLVGNVDSVYAYITVDGKFYKEIPLTGQLSAKEYEIHSSHGFNTIIVENESITVIDADCPDHICEQFGTISKPGEVIVCLPNQVYIEVKGSLSEKTEDEEDSRTY